MTKIFIQSHDARSVRVSMEGAPDVIVPTTELRAFLHHTEAEAGPLDIRVESGPAPLHFARRGRGAAIAARA